MDARADLDAVHFGHHDIEQHDIDRGRIFGGASDIEDLEGFPAGCRGDDAVVTGGQQSAFGQIAGILLIVDYKYPHVILRICTKIWAVFICYLLPVTASTVASFSLTNKRHVLFWYMTR